MATAAEIVTARQATETKMRERDEIDAKYRQTPAYVQIRAAYLCRWVGPRSGPCAKLCIQTSIYFCSDCTKKYEVGKVKAMQNGTFDYSTVDQKTAAMLIANPELLERRNQGPVPAPKLSLAERLVSCQTSSPPRTKSTSFALEYIPPKKDRPSSSSFALEYKPDSPKPSENVAIISSSSVAMPVSLPAIRGRASM